MTSWTAYSSSASSPSHQHLLQVPTGLALLVACYDVLDDPPLGPDGGTAPYAAVSYHHNSSVQAKFSVYARDGLLSLLDQPASRSLCVMSASCTKTADFIKDHISN